MDITIKCRDAVIMSCGKKNVEVTLRDVERYDFLDYTDELLDIIGIERVKEAFDLTERELEF